MTREAATAVECNRLGIAVPAVKAAAIIVALPIGFFLSVPHAATAHNGPPPRPSSCRPSVTPSWRSSPDRHRSDAQTAENGSARARSANKSAKVVLVDNPTAPRLSGRRKEVQKSCPRTLGDRLGPTVDRYERAGDRCQATWRHGGRFTAGSPSARSRR